MLDPFAGGGAVPPEAMRLGCEATAADINPVARFILRCTLHYPHAMAGGAARGLGEPAGAPQSQLPLQGLPVSDGAGSAIAVTA